MRSAFGCPCQPHGKPLASVRGVGKSRRADLRDSVTPVLTAESSGRAGVGSAASAHSHDTQDRDDAASRSVGRCASASSTPDVVPRDFGGSGLRPEGSGSQPVHCRPAGGLRPAGGGARGDNDLYDDESCQSMPDLATPAVAVRDEHDKPGGNTTWLRTLVCQGQGSDLDRGAKVRAMMGSPNDSVNPMLK